MPFTKKLTILAVISPGNNHGRLQIPLWQNRIILHAPGNYPAAICYKSHFVPERKFIHTSVIRYKIKLMHICCACIKGTAINLPPKPSTPLHMSPGRAAPGNKCGASRKKGRLSLELITYNLHPLLFSVSKK